MIKLYKGGAYLLNGMEVVEDCPNATEILKSKTGMDVDKSDAAKATMAYGILESHNTSSDMKKLKLRFDKLTSHDITYVGIIQTARASGLEKFPMPYAHAKFLKSLRGLQNDFLQYAPRLSFC